MAKKSLKNMLFVLRNAFYPLSQYLAPLVPISVIPLSQILEYPHNRYWDEREKVLESEMSVFRVI
jgi:hypothetical protein